MKLVLKEWMRSSDDFNRAEQVMWRKRTKYKTFLLKQRKPFQSTLKGNFLFPVETIQNLELACLPKLQNILSTMKKQGQA